MSTKEDSEQELLERLRRGDQSAWRWLFRAYADRIHSFCLRMVRSRETAEDITQEVFKRAFEAIGHFRGDASIKTWLLKIAFNLCLTHIAAAKKDMVCTLDYDLVANVQTEERGGDCSVAAS